LIALGTDAIITGANARLGDIGVIGFDPQLFAFRLAPSKVYSVLVRQARDIAESKGRPPELAEAMIDKDVLVYRRVDAQGRAEFTTRRVEPNIVPQPLLDGGWALIPSQPSGSYVEWCHLELGLARPMSIPAELDKRPGSESRLRTRSPTLVFWLNLLSPR
jgi:hypothetical protein